MALMYYVVYICVLCIQHYIYLTIIYSRILYRHFPVPENTAAPKNPAENPDKARKDE